MVQSPSLLAPGSGDGGRPSWGHGTPCSHSEKPHCCSVLITHEPHVCAKPLYNSMPQLRVRGQELLKLFLFIYQSSTLSVSVTVKNAVWRGELKWGLVGGAVGRCSRKNLQEIMHFGFDGTSCMKLETVNQTVTACVTAWNKSIIYSGNRNLCSRRD